MDNYTCTTTQGGEKMAERPTAGETLDQELEYLTQTLNRAWETIGALELRIEALEQQPDPPPEPDLPFDGKLVMEYDEAKILKGDHEWTERYINLMGPVGTWPPTGNWRAVQLPNRHYLTLPPNYVCPDIWPDGVIDFDHEVRQGRNHTQLRLVESPIRYMSSAGGWMAKPNVTYAIVMRVDWRTFPERWCNLLQFWGKPPGDRPGNDICAVFFKHDKIQLVCWPRDSDRYEMSSKFTVPQGAFRLCLICNSEVGCELFVEFYSGWQAMSKIDTAIGSGELLDRPDGWAAINWGTYSPNPCRVLVDHVGVHVIE